jgi:hypothetical protein
MSAIRTICLIGCCSCIKWAPQDPTTQFLFIGLAVAFAMVVTWNAKA